MRRSTAEDLVIAHQRAREVFRPGVVIVPGGENIRSWAARERARANSALQESTSDEKTSVDTSSDTPFSPFNSPLAVKILVGAAAVGLGYFAGRWWKAQQRAKAGPPRPKLTQLTEPPSWAMT